MKSSQIKHNNIRDTSKLASKVLHDIEKITPISRFTFLCIHCYVWILWAISVLIGAISVSVLIYVGNHARFEFFEATHSSRFSFFVEILPYVWILTFFGMIILSYVNMRHTKQGYKYPLWQLLLSNIFFSSIGGVLLYFSGVGYIIDTQFARYIPLYQSLEATEQKMWQQPQEGRLLGVFISTDESIEVSSFFDKNNTLWQIQTIDLRDEDRQLLSSGNVVRVLGTTTDAKLFHACGVFPWLFDADTSLVDMKKDRQLFVDRMYEHMDAGERLDKLEQATFDENTDMPFGEGVCAKLSVIKRMKF